VTDYAKLAELRDDLRAAVNPLPIPLRLLNPDGTTTIQTSRDYTIPPSRDQGPFFDVATVLWAVVQVAPRVWPWGRTATYKVTGTFDPDGDFAVTIGGVTTTHTGAPGDTVTQVLTGLGAAVVGDGTATDYRVHSVSGAGATSVGQVDLYLTDATDAFSAYTTTTATTIAGAVDPVAINDVWLYGRLNDNVDGAAPTNDVTINRSGWALYTGTNGCYLQGSVGPDGWMPLIDVRPYRWLYPLVGEVVGVDGDDTNALAAGAFRSIRVRPCSYTGRVIP